MKDKTGTKLTNKQIARKTGNRLYNYYLDLKLLCLTCIGYIPFNTVRKFFYRLSGIKMGKNSTIHMWARFYQPKNISIGDDTIIGDHCFLDGRDRLKIGSHVAIASQVLIYNSQHDIDDPNFRPIEKPVEIEDYVFIGPRAIILPGVKISRGAIVAAGAVVSKNIEPYTVVGGVPAKEIRKRKLQSLDYKLGRARLFQ
jgi:acetyltransferase-like isoleucine patch superfamily enzyme